MNVFITTLGCKANQYDSFAIEEMLTMGDFQVVPDLEEADACIINTCTVTGKYGRAGTAAHQEGEAGEFRCAGHRNRVLRPGVAE